ncbi:MAG: tryptophan--tRNA ligase, partial [bacterium]|nr:tryptophan--tRNA ligase [bacterium]
MVRKRILSGMRPTGKLHIGHILGALKNWVRLQDEYQCYYMVADLHALTSEYEDTGKMQENVREMVIDWLACGIDPAKSTLLVQSRIPEHSELHLILSMITP